MRKIKENNKILGVLLIITIIMTSLLIYNRARADMAANKIAMDYASIKRITTGSSFTDDGSDGITYEEDGYTIKSYNAGYDSSADNRLVRSFDTLKYSFDYNIKGKNDNNSYEERVVSIKVTLSDEEAKYVTFGKNSKPGEKTHTFDFEGINTYENSFSSEITLYVLGAPDKTNIDPKFEIFEKTNTDNNYVITLGKVNDSTHYYLYDSEKSQKYATAFTGENEMPTIVSSKPITTLGFKLLPQTSEGQKATYNDVVGRYLTYVGGIYLVGGETSIRGYTMPNGGDITFDVSLSQNGSTKTIMFDNSWFRLYAPSNVSEIEPVVVSLPYSASSNDMNMIKFPGNVSVSKKDDNTYNCTIKNYFTTYASATNAADGVRISDANYISSFAFSVFSPRTKEDGKNDITTTMTISNFNAVDTTGNKITTTSPSSITSNIVNKYYENIDYSLVGEFYDVSGEKVSAGEYYDNETKTTLTDINGTGSTSKGEILRYKTTFNYKKTLSDQGLKEIIKVDTNAFRVVPLDDNNDVKITIEGDKNIKLKPEDFEIKYVTGSFDNSNYSATNYDESSSNKKLNSEDLATIQSSCKTVKDKLSTYSQSQIQNLYGGPCITVNDNVEQTFDRILDAKEGGAEDDNKSNDSEENQNTSSTEIPITKVIVQTKKGVKLPDNVKVIVEVGIRVKNVSDLTQTYQATAIATSSDYDDNVSYYSPRVTTDENSVANPNNYKKTIYQGSSISSIDTDSVWGDSLRIVNFKSRSIITVTNKNTDGSIKTNYNSNNSETIHYNVKTNIVDENEIVGADDVWWINNLKVIITIPKDLIYIPDKDLGTPEVTTDASSNTILTYTLPYTKPNQKIKDLNFKAMVSPTIKGSGVPVTVTSEVVAVNINNEIDASYFKKLKGSFTIYATGIQNVIVQQKIGESGSVVEKNSEFSYLLGGYNNASENIDDYTIVDILPSNGDKNKSKFSGSYKVKVTIPSSLGNAKISCSTQEYSKLANEIENKNNEFKECNITEEYVDATAIKITDISINSGTYMDDIVVSIKPKDNNYGDKYINAFVGGSKEYSENHSNKIEARVVSRTISGNVFIDLNEDGVKDDSDTRMENIPLTLYKLDSENNMTKLDDTISDKNGYYEFKNLDVGRYKVRASYNSDLYDLTLRYGIEDVAVDSDAYKIEEGIVEISNKRTPDESMGILVTRDIESVDNMDIGLISRKRFGFDISKYITKIDLSYNNTLTTYNYENQSKVLLSVKNSLNATAKVYYGIRIENNSTKAGYVKVINEDIPTGLVFDSNSQENAGWFYQNGELRNVSLENDLIKPGESRYLTVALNMPRQQEARTFVNTVTLLDIEEYDPEPLSDDKNADANNYKIGESVIYAGVNWHVIETSNEENGEQILTLLADEGTIKTTMSHTTNKNDIYKWSDSLINAYINGDFANTNMLNLPILYDSSVCDDASGLVTNPPTASYGGTLLAEGMCLSNVYKPYKVRLLTENEFNKLVKNNTEDLSWLKGTKDFWLMNSVNVEHKYDSYGRIKEITEVSNLAKYVNSSTNTVQTGYNTSSTSSWVRSNAKKEVRPVITVSSNNVILE